ncbi:sigma 54-interacting transcriptional regulator [Brevibacillus sp. H7]|uniref:sigma 54-interacting transcriptional regulator n=1 Tax=Brevibacillus sp. H7 TaxID=3349138 RepID=UPI00381D1E3F
MLKVRDFSTRHYIQVSPQSTIREVLFAFLTYRLDIACVVSKQKLLGIVTKYSLYRVLLRDHSLETPIQPIMKTNVVTLDVNQDLFEAREILLHKNVGHAVVLDEEGKVFGIMAKHDLINGSVMVVKTLADRMKALVEHLQDGIISVDTRLNITMYNTAAAALFHFQTIPQRSDTPISTVLPHVEACFRDTIDSGKIVEGKRMELPSLTVIASFIPIKEFDKVTGAMGVFRDVTDYEKIAQELETTRRLQHEVSFYRDELLKIQSRSQPFAHIISQSDIMEKVKKDALIAAASFSSVLLTGESGTGKELFALGIHKASGRTGPLIKVNCAAIPEALLESEFFGYEEGAFSGAKKGGKPGKFELAHNGTLFLDEIGDMPLTLQAKLLRVLQEKEFERVGGTHPRQANVRIVAATNKDLQRLVKEQKFREDLYYRIHVIHLHIPSLHERIEDIPLLCHAFIEKCNARTNRTVIGVTPEAISLLKRVHWQGNVRQLENVIERAFHFTESSWIEPKHLPPNLQQRSVSFDETENRPARLSSHLPSRRKMIEETEKQAIVQALSLVNGNKSKAAELLGISRSAFYQKMKLLKISTVASVQVDE